MKATTISRWLLVAGLFTGALGIQLAQAENSVTVAWQNSNSSSKRLKDGSGVADLNAGMSSPGDGTVIQLGYYSSGTPATPFAGSYIPLTGAGGANPSFATTSMGDAPGGAAGRFSIVTTFVEGSPAAGQSLPSPGTPLVIRFYNSQLVATSTHYNEVSNSSTNWQWKSPTEEPGESVILSLSDPGLVWKGNPFQTSVSLDPSLTFTLNPTSSAIPQAGGTGTVTVTASNQSGQWSAVSNVPWITITTGSSETGNGSVAFTVAANTGIARSGTLTIANESFTVNQAGAAITVAWGDHDGLYYGLAQAAVSNVDAGPVSLKILATGAATGKLTFMGKTYALKGTFDINGVLQTTITRKGAAPLSVDLRLDPATDRITGTIADGSATIEVSTGLAPYDKRANPAPQAGTYTFLLDAGSDDVKIPHGIGYGTLSVSTSGSIKIKGALPDGSVVSAGVLNLASDGGAPFFAALYAKKGVVVGSFHFQSAPQPRTIGGTLGWTKPVTSAKTAYPAGFNATLTIVGSIFEPRAKGLRLIDLPSGDNNASVTLEGFGLESASGELETLARLGTLTSQNVMFFPVLGPERLTLKISRTGAMTGSFLEMGSGKKRKFGGVILQEQDLGGGFYKGTSTTGSVLLESSTR